MTVPVSKNDEVVVDIIGLTHEGEGVGRADGFTLFIQGALPGERVRAKVLKVKKTYGYAKLLDLVVASPDRVDAPCGIFKQCGGCQLQHLSYSGQLGWKRQHVVDNLERIGKLLVVGGDGATGESAEGGSGEGQTDERGSDNVGGQNEWQGIVVHPTIGMDEPWRYRNKASVPIGMSIDNSVAGAGSGEGRLIGGFYAHGSHRIIDMDACLIQHSDNDDIIGQVKSIARELGVSAYNEETGRGLLRHVMVRVGFVTGEAMIVLITNGLRIPKVERCIERIREAFPRVKSIVQNINTRKTNVIFGYEIRVLWGSEVIYDELDGIRFAISARSFYQVNPVQTVELYRKAVEYAGLTGAETVIDAYCGIGTISLFLAGEPVACTALRLCRRRLRMRAGTRH